MTYYCGSADLIRRWGIDFLKQTSDLNNSYEAVRWDAVGAAQAEADGYIDAKLAGAWANRLPFAEVPDQIPPLAARLTGYFLALGGRRKSPEMVLVKEHVDDVLGHIAAGRLQMTVSGQPLDPAGDLLASTTSSHLPQFRRRWTDASGEVVSAGTMEDW
jgi:phage gp36-like protein